MQFVFLSDFKICAGSPTLICFICLMILVWKGFSCTGKLPSMILVTLPTFSTRSLRSWRMAPKQAVLIRHLTKKTPMESKPVLKMLLWRGPRIVALVERRKPPQPSLDACESSNIAPPSMKKQNKEIKNPRLRPLYPLER